MTRAPRAQHERLWLSRQPDRLADTSTWYMTPVKSYADLKSLRDLLQLTGRGDQEALPVLWEDNYLSLLPGETRVVTATYRVRDLGGALPQLVVSGWNVPRTIAR